MPGLRRTGSRPFNTSSDDASYFDFESLLNRLLFLMVNLLMVAQDQQTCFPDLAGIKKSGSDLIRSRFSVAAFVL